MPDNIPHELERLFYPRSIAVVGATPKDKQMGSGNMFIQGAFHQGFQGDIYPVNPDADRILGYKAYHSVRDIPGEVDLAIFAIPLSAVIPVMEDCAAKGVKFVHMFTAGFSETGHARYAEAEQKALAIAREGGIRVVGPNCMGIYCPDGGVAFQERFPTAKGKVAFVSQSGSLVNGFVDNGARKGLRYSKVVSFGNAADLQPHDFLHYLRQDEKTEVIGVYIEGLKNGRAFFEIAREITPHKPVVAMKGGLTEGGSRATRSHTASIAGSPRIWQALCKQAGIIQVESVEELIHTLAALQRLPRPAGLNAAIFGEFGGGSVLMTDVAEKAGLKVPHLSDKAISKLEEFLPLAGHSVKNPLDAAMAMVDQNSFIRLIEILRDESGIDALIFIQQMGIVQGMLGGRQGMRHFFKMALKARDILGKPVFVVMEREDSVRLENMRHELEEDYHRAGLATFSSFQIAARVFHNLYQYGQFLEHRG